MYDCKGDLPIQIKWTLNNEPIISGENGITVNKLAAKTSVLNIASVEKEHRGHIKCIAENMAGVDTYASELRVNGKQFWNAWHNHLKLPIFTSYLNILFM